MKIVKFIKKLSEIHESIKKLYRQHNGAKGKVVIPRF